MGVIVDLTPRLTLARRLRVLLKDLQFKSIRSTRLYVRAIDLEIARQEHIVCRRESSYDQIEEAISALELLGELAQQRRHYLDELEREFAGVPLD